VRRIDNGVTCTLSVLNARAPEIRVFSPGPTVIDDEVLTRLKLTAYEAASDGARWQCFLDDLRRCFGATSAHLRVTPPPGHKGELWWVESGIDPEVKIQYSTHWGAHDPWGLHPDGHKRSTTGRCYVGSQILPWSDLVKTAFYNDFGRFSGLKGVMSAMVEDGGHSGRAPETKLVLFRDPVLPEFDAQALKAYESLQEPLRRAFNSFWMLRQVQDLSLAVEEAFNASASAIFVLRHDGVLEYANKAGEHFHRQGMVQIQGGEVRSIAQLCHANLRDMMRAAGASGTQECLLWAVQEHQVRTGRMSLAPVSDQAALLNHWPRARFLLTIEIDNAARAQCARLDAIRLHYALTPTETKVLALLAQGQTAEAVALAHGVRISTVRSQIRSLLEKTYSRRMVDLLRLVGS
jgi:DNA-binding CsgD family transcriptional regulator